MWPLSPLLGVTSGSGKQAIQDRGAAEGEENGSTSSATPEARSASEHGARGPGLEGGVSEGATRATFPITATGELSPPRC